MCVLAVLLGLFGMHGVTGGCHADGMAAAPTAMAMPVDAHPPVTAMSGPSRSVTAMSASLPAMSGPSCLFVAPAGWPPLALVVLGLGVVAVLVSVGAWSGAWASGRSPPRSGTSLLRRVCVSRT